VYFLGHSTDSVYCHIYHTVSPYKHYCNFIYTNNNSMAIPVPISGNSWMLISIVCSSLVLNVISHQTMSVRTTVWKFWCFSAHASWHRIVSNYQLNAQFLYSITIYMLHYNPRHVSSSTMLIFRRTKLYHYSIWYCHSL